LNEFLQLVGFLFRRLGLLDEPRTHHAALLVVHLLAKGFKVWVPEIVNSDSPEYSEILIYEICHGCLHPGRTSVLIVTFAALKLKGSCSRGRRSDARNTAAQESAGRRKIGACHRRLSQLASGNRASPGRPATAARAAQAWAVGAANLGDLDGGGSLLSTQAFTGGGLGGRG
jgi:hypothetical protein